MPQPPHTTQQPRPQPASAPQSPLSVRQQPQPSASTPQSPGELQQKPQQQQQNLDDMFASLMGPTSTSSTTKKATPGVEELDQALQSIDDVLGGLQGLKFT